MRGAITDADIASWNVAGSYKTREALRHRYDVGMSYSAQRYAGGNPLALRDVRDGSRNAGTVYGFDTFALTPLGGGHLRREVRALRLPRPTRSDQPPVRDHTDSHGESPS